METSKRDFDKMAATWDEDPIRVKLANDIGKAIADAIALAPTMDVLDFGCGTGLLGLQFCSRVRSVTGVDSSQGMLDIFRKKITRQNLANARAVWLDLEAGAELPGVYDLAMSSMTLHHVKETRPLLDRLFKATKPSGHICVTDLDLEDGQFHDSHEGVFHFGFDRAALRSLFLEAGFQDVRDVTAAERVKKLVSGESRRFTVFLMTGRKPPLF